MQSTATTEIERVSISDFYASPGKIAEQLKHTGQIVLINNDGPMAVMLDVDGSTLEDTMRDLRFLRMRKAIKAIQDVSVESGLSKMTLEEINEEIAAARAARKAGETNR